MNTVVWKYVMPAPACDFALPEDARFLHVGEQSGAVCLWIELDPEAEVSFRGFRAYGTGHEIKNGHTYIGTAFVGPLVWHIYEETKQAAINDGEVLEAAKGATA